MLWLQHLLSHHGLDHSDVAVQATSERPSSQCHPEVWRKPDYEQRQHRPSTAREQDGLATDLIGETSPVHAAECLSESKRGNEDACEERGIAVVANFELEDILPGIGEY